MIKKIFFFLFFPLILLLTHLTFWPGSGHQFVDIDISEGMTFRDVSQKLIEAKLINHTLPLRIWARVKKADRKVQVGRYQFSEGRSAYWIIDDLVNGRALKAKVVIPEGFSSWQIAERLEILNVCKAEAFKAVVNEESLEGFLYPSTYDINVNASPKDVAHIMKAQFDRRWTKEMEARTKELGWTQKDAVTMASILEREIRVREELPLVSAVYNNRLKKKMRLEADPTVQYGMGFWKKRLTYDDYRKTDSPYNTYLHAGLPPGPICNPDIEAIKAALWPAPSNALFMLAQEDGHHTFSESYHDHTNKVNKRNKEISKKRTK